MTLSRPLCWTVCESNMKNDKIKQHSPNLSIFIDQSCTINTSLQDLAFAYTQGEVVTKTAIEK